MDGRSVMLHSQFWECWWVVSMCLQGTSNHCIDSSPHEYCGLKTSKVKLERFIILTAKTDVYKG